MIDIKEHIKPPFADLHNQHNLGDFLNYMASELTVEELNIWLPLETNKEDVSIYIKNIDKDKVVLGRVNYEQIMLYAADILERFNTLMKGLKSSLPDKEKRSSILRQYAAITQKQKEATHQFNPLRFLKHLKIFAQTVDFREQVMLHQFSFLQADWDNLRMDFQYRFYVWEEFNRSIFQELLEIEHEAFPENAYSWSGTSVELTEVALALFESEKVNFKNIGSKNEFIRDFLNWFSIPGTFISRDIENILGRKQESKFLDKLATRLNELKKEPKGKKSRKR